MDFGEGSHIRLQACLSLLLSLPLPLPARPPSLPTCACVCVCVCFQQLPRQQCVYVYMDGVEVKSQGRRHMRICIMEWGEGWLQCRTII